MDKNYSKGRIQPAELDTCVRVCNYYAKHTQTVRYSRRLACTMICHSVGSLIFTQKKKHDRRSKIFNVTDLSPICLQFVSNYTVYTKYVFQTATSRGYSLSLPHVYDYFSQSVSLLWRSVHIHDLHYIDMSLNHRTEQSSWSWQPP